MTDEYEPRTDYDIERDTFLAELLPLDRWFVWALDQDRKIPRAPWANPEHIDKYVSWKDEANWVDFETADEWAAKVGRFGHASCIPAFEDNSTERLIFFDFDDCRDPETGAIHGQVWAFIEKYGLSAYLSTSGTGVHAFGWGSLPEGYKPSFEIPMPAWDFADDPHLEVYASARFMALTGEHITATPVSAPDLGDLAHELFEAKGTERTTGTEREPDVSRAELADVDSTTDVSDIYDAIRHVRPSDIRLQSPKTEEYSSGRDANYARDPSWANSTSGTRLAEFDDHWLYRKGNHNLDALQVVALEERIIHDEATYPEGEDFVDAVDALRDRGAHIPELEATRPELSFDPSEETEAEAAAETEPGTATDGGAAASTTDSDADGPASPPEPEPDGNDFADDVQAVVGAYENDDISLARCRQRIAEGFTYHYDFVYPEEEVRGWREALYVYNPDGGIYERRGERFIEKHLERVAGMWVNNTRKNEVVAKVKRRSIARGDQFRTDPERLVVANGILDLHTGEKDEFTPQEYHRTKLDVAWNPDAGDPTAVDEFLHDIVDDSDVPTLYRLIAHTVYKEYVAEKAAILIGSGQNGKSVFLDFIEQFIGRHNVSHRELQDFSTDDYAENNLRGKLANLATEIGEQELKDTTTFKKLTGRDTMDAPVKYESPVTFENYATLMFSTNEMPVFGQDNRAIWRRWVYVDFPYTFKDDDPDAKDPVDKRTLLRRLTTDDQLEALLLRCQQEIQRWHETDEAFFEAAMDPEEVREKMKKAAEPVYFFASACLRAGDVDEDAVPKPLVRRAYREFARAEDLPTIPENEFGGRLLALRDFNIEAVQRRASAVNVDSEHVGAERPRVYAGVTLSSRGRQLLDLDTVDDEDQTEVDEESDSRQATAVVLEEARTMLDENDNEPVPRSGLVWRVAGDIGKATAENAVDTLIDTGRLLELDNDLLTTK